MEQSSIEEQKYGKCMECKKLGKLMRTSILGPSILCQICDSNLKAQKFGRCIECKQENTGHNWCQTCNSKRCYGISQDPDTKEYIMVMQYANKGSLRNYLNEKNKKIYNEYKKNKYYETNLDLNLQIWGYKVGILRNISIGLRRIHDKGLIHRDLHSGNIECFDANPSNRPSANDLSRTFCDWKEELNKYTKNKNYDETELIETELIKQINEINDSLSNTTLTNKMHPGAIYTSRLLNYNNLPKPKNSDDYYVSYDDISSVEYSDLIESDRSECLECEVTD
ncbi:uncharacterized protein OCT59_011686 [Rhizophagus irregularis]|uniref:uncharacterized protein n=1 Tax=Rhizophagus irregularis TaxID=588596 RepID=UPI0033239D91|nr:hypothetical protein OCT59_011686 [Rhizophagus irregularis]